MVNVARCIDDEALFALARGELAGAELASAEAHLQGCADCRAVLAEAARALEPPLGDSSQPSRATPTTIARYQVVSLIGAGASGVVYRGFDPQLKRTVALKVLRPDLHGAHPEQSQRMLREAQSMARLSDPHVVAVYDVGLHQGTVYLVMEYIDGLTLSAWLKAAPRSRAEILKVFDEAGRGLHAAHQKGLVHRDFKPENVLVARDGRARVTDFGLARESENWLGDRVVDDQASTELYAPTRGLIGTPAYMAPELFEGGLATPASDQFALCVALFVALFDKHPFRAGEGIALSELVTRVRAGTLETPVTNSLADQRLLAVLRRGISPDVGARYPDVTALLAALASARRGAGKQRVVVGLVVLAVVALFMAGRLLKEPPAEAAAVPLPSVSLALPSAAAPSLPALPPAPAPATAPAASAATSAVAPSSAAPTEKRRLGQKPSDVRYKDWLKEPF